MHAYIHVHMYIRMYVGMEKSLQKDIEAVDNELLLVQTELNDLLQVCTYVNISVCMLMILLYNIIYAKWFRELQMCV